jgi:hypothetical protein
MCGGSVLVKVVVPVHSLPSIGAFLLLGHWSWYVCRCPSYSLTVVLLGSSLVGSGPDGASCGEKSCVRGTLWILIQVVAVSFQLSRSCGGSSSGAEGWFCGGIFLADEEADAL